MKGGLRRDDGDTGFGVKVTSFDSVSLRAKAGAKRN